MQAYSDCGFTISVQPFHKTEKAYEQLSILFNFIQIAANGTALPKPINIGLYGPVILISKSDYTNIGGHESVKMSIVEDMALAHRLKETGLAYQLFVGDQDLSFRMYGDGLKGLLQGWLKNTAAGAAKTTPGILVMVFFWITSLLSVPLHVIGFAFSGDVLWLVIYLLLYIAWAIILICFSKRIGQFYPLGHGSISVAYDCVSRGVCIFHAKENIRVKGQMERACRFGGGKDMRIIFLPSAWTILLCFIVWPVMQITAALICFYLPDRMFFSGRFLFSAPSF